MAANYGLKSTQDQQALDIAARQTAADVSQAISMRTTPADVDQKIATALLPLVAQTALDAALALRDRRLDAAEAALAALQAAGFQTAADVAAALATALAAYTDTAGLNALLAVRDARLDLQGAGPFATAADLSASEASLQSAIDALNSALAALTTGGGTNLANAQAWPGQTTWDLLVGTNTIRNWHFSAPLSVSLENDNFTLSLACDAYTQGEVNTLLAPLASESWALATLGSDYTSAETNGAITAALASYYTSAQTDAAIAAALVPYSTTAQMDAAIAAAVGAIDQHHRCPGRRALVPYSTTTQMDAAIAASVGTIDLSAYSTIAARDAAIAAALVPYSTTVQTSTRSTSP